MHEKKSDGTLKELHKASGGPWGGNVVDNNYIQFYEKLFGQDTMNRFKKEEMIDYFDLLRDFSEANVQELMFIKCSKLFN